jgi:hypothetical protein
MKIQKILLLLMVMTLPLFACSVKVNPVLNTSLGMSAFDSMGKIDVRDASLAVYFDPKIKELEVQQKIKVGEFTFPVGPAFCAKMMKALSYHFRTVQLVNEPSYAGNDPVNALMRISLQDADISMGVKAGWSTVKTEGYTRLSIRADVVDLVEKRTVWVGTTQTKEEGVHQEYMQMTYQEAGRGFAQAIDVAIDKAVGDLMGQMRKSANLCKYFESWERANRSRGF